MVTGASTRKASTEPAGEETPPPGIVVVVLRIVGGGEGSWEELGEVEVTTVREGKHRGERRQFIKCGQALPSGLSPDPRITGQENSQQSSPRRKLLTDHGDLLVRDSNLPRDSSLVAVLDSN